MGADKTFAIARIDKKAGGKLPRLPFLRMKNKVLGRSYVLSLTLIGDSRARALNKQYRNKAYTPNVLSFPLGKMNGEIMMNLRQAKREHAARGESLRYFIALLFVHSLLHLKGARHGSTMEKQVDRVLREFRITNAFRVRRVK